MKTFRFVFTFIITLTVGIIFNTRLVISGTPIPPLGKFLSPFHGFWQNAENEAIDLDPIISSEGISDEVNVHFDDLYIPHIFAQNEEDLFFTQGYVEAYHRLWQMEFQLYAAAGRLSELVGEAALDFDRKQRRMGLGFGAENGLQFNKAENPEMYAYIEAYSNGINEYINSLSFKELPVEYKLLDYKPEQWTPYKCFLFLSLMHYDLSGGDSDLENSNALSLWGREDFNILFPDRLPDLNPIIPSGTVFDFDPLPLPEPDSINTYGIINPVFDGPDKDNGSNSFIAGPSKTASGNTILTNEMDLGLSLPSIWYSIHLNSPNVNAMGVSFPGVPVVINGFNDSIAWGHTNSRADVLDWYKIVFEDEKRNKYRYNNNWIPTDKVVEEIKVRNGDSYYDTVVYTHHGPVVYDKYFQHPRSDRYTNLAMKWMGHTPYKEFDAFWECNKANNFNDYREALKNFSGPAQNWSYADTKGNIALTVAGQFPLKWNGQGKFIMDGNNPTHEWTEFIPYEHNPYVINPEEDYIKSANQHPVDSLYPYSWYDHHFEYFRNRRLDDRLKIMQNITVEEMMKLQHDNFNYNAFEMLPMMLDSLDSTQLSPVELKYVELLKSWDNFNGPLREAPSVYQTWLNNLKSILWEEFDSADVKLIRPHNYNTYHILKNKPNFFMIDNQETESIESTGDLFRQSFKLTVEKLEEYLNDNNNNSLEWYRFKNTTIRHLTRQAPFSIDQIKIGGGRGIVNAASTYHGPSWRMVVELGDNKVTAWGVYPGSQSGNPGNPNYGHMIEDWAAGNYNQLLFDKNLTADSDKINYSITLQPE